MFCPKCGNEIIDENAKFCDKCGHSLDSTELVVQINRFDYSVLNFTSMLSLSWDIFKKEAIFLILFYIGMVVLNFVPFVNFVVSFIIGVIILPFFYVLIKKYEKKEKLIFNDIFYGIKKFWKLLIGNLLNFVISLIGVCILIFISLILIALISGVDVTNFPDINTSSILSNVMLIPVLVVFLLIFIFFSVFAGMLINFTSLRITDSYSGVIESISYSIKNIWKNFSTIIFYYIGISIIAILGTILTIGFGFFVFIPILMIFQCLMYLKFKED